MTQGRRDSSRQRGSGLARNHAGARNPERMPLHELIQLQDDLLDGETYFSEGVLTPAQERRLDAIAGSSHRKIELIGTSICDDLEVIAGIEFAEQRLVERKRIRLRRIERKKDYLQLCMERLGIPKVDGTLCTVTLQRNAVTATRRGPRGSQSDLFATPHPATAGSHVRIR